MLSLSYVPSSCSRTEKAKAKEAKSRLSNTVEAEKMKFRNTWSAGSAQTQHQTKRHPSKESVLPKGHTISTLSDLQISFKSQQ